MLLRTVAPDVRGPAAVAFWTLAIGSVPSAARAPPARPDRRRKVRRSRPSLCPDKPAAIDPCEADSERCCVLLISTAASSRRVTIDAVIGLHVIAFLVARLAFLIVGLAIGARGSDQGCCQRRPRADRANADLAKEIAATTRRFLLVPHRISPRPAAPVSWRT